ncbi:PIG-L family deacetylase [Cellulomonas composti]|uniref:1D-myo-inositol 2-acetamido-2-deoxy-alpha-D-glucopyranoside deacetylase n=1 Tax=Cellulomonas composti TaxID=266130 RepID=A0A511JCI3_9CELL|nr:PIG-L family deacetylase [Cellulomonas composti]GEL95711.1 1D-myo-inositol 2-acetamido-2-deoxy-alpha-D-glucopyranoside deacetylase [Cellulomonas composti]
MTSSATGGLLAVHAHPDDETLATGALLATWAAAGLPVTLVTCTRGECGEVLGEHGARLQGDGPALAAHREAELAAASRALGVVDHAFLDTLPDETGSPAPHRYEDSGMAWDTTGRVAVAGHSRSGAFTRVEPDEAAGRLAALVVDRRPALVVTYEPHGGYGHPDHVRAHEVTVRALELAAERGVRPAFVWAAQSRAAATAARRALVRLATTDLFAPVDDGGFASVVVDDHEVDLEVDVSPVRERVLAALRAHATQVQGVLGLDDEPTLQGRYALSLGMLEPLLPQEQYRYAPGSPRLTGALLPVGLREVEHEVEG